MISDNLEIQYHDCRDYTAMHELTNWLQVQLTAFASQDNPVYPQ